MLTYLPRTLDSEWRNPCLVSQMSTFDVDFMDACLQGDIDEIAGFIDEMHKGVFSGIFGPFIHGAGFDDAKQALSVLRTTVMLHLMLHTHCPKKSIYGDPDALRLVEAAEALLGGQGVFFLERGPGYPLDNDPGGYESRFCKIYRCRIPLTPLYAKWLAPRIKTFASMGTLIEATPIFYLNMDQACVIEGVEEPVLTVEICASQSLNSRFEEFLYEYEKHLPEETNLAEYELYAGLLHLADIISSIHLLGAIPIVKDGWAARESTGDFLTHLWERVYVRDGERAIHAGVCEVCGGLFVSEKDKMRGHAACMNRQRVRRSRARKYKKALESGMTPKEASSMAKIASGTADAMIANGEV